MRVLPLLVFVLMISVASRAAALYCTAFSKLWLPRLSVNDSYLNSIDPSLVFGASTFQVLGSRLKPGARRPPS